MVSLIKKDLILHKKAIMVFMAIVIFYFPVLLSDNDGRGIITISFFYSAMLPLIIFVREEKFNGNTLFCSLPFKRKNVVLGRYLSSWILIVIGIIYCLSISSLINFFFFENNPLFWEMVSLKGILSGFLMLSVIIFFWFPLNFKFGIGKGAIVGFLLVGIFLFFSSFSSIGQNFNPIHIIRSIVRVFQRSMDYISFIGGDLSLYSMLIIITFLLNFVSFKASLWIFNRKEL